MYLWEIQFNQFRKQPKWHDLQRLQWEKSKIYKPRNIGEELPNFYPFPTMDLLMRNPWHWSRNFLHYAVLKMYILHFSLSNSCIQYIRSIVLLAQHRKHFLIMSAYKLSFLHSFKAQWYIRVRRHISFKSTGLLIFYKWDYLNLF